MSKQIINNVEVADFCEDGTTISITATAATGEQETFHVQTVDGEYRYSLGCWILTNDSNGDIESDDYPAFDLAEIINAAEDHAEALLKDDERTENPNYYNKDASPYTCRFI